MYRDFAVTTGLSVIPKGSLLMKFEPSEMKSKGEYNLCLIGRV
jgi:hypothetical protein